MIERPKALTLSWEALAAWLVLFVYGTLTIYTHFHSGRYGYHDLTLLNDVFSNGAYGRNFFHVTDMGVSYVKYHFAPTLLLIVPFYRIFDSQFLLVALGSIAYFGGILLFAHLGTLLLERSKALATLPKEKAQLFTKIFAFISVVLMATNRYGKNSLMSAHYEVFFVAIGAFLFWALIENKGRKWIIPSFILFVGLRGDAAFFLFFHLVALFFVPKWVPKAPDDFRRWLKVLSVTAVLYFLALTFIVGPWVGAVNQISRWWGHLGATPAAIVMTLLTSPKYVWNRLNGGGLLPFNLSFYLLPAVAPIFFIIANLSAGPVYFINAPERASLFYYHSAVFLPVFYLGSLVGLVTMMKWAKTEPKRKLALATFAVIFFAQSLTLFDTNVGMKFRPDPLKRSYVQKALLEAIGKCRGIRSVAADFHSIVFVPNSRVPILLKDYRGADLVFISSTGSALLSGADNLGTARNRIQADPNFISVPAPENDLMFRRRGLHCPH